MKLNLLEIAVLAALVVLILSGMRKGFVRKLASVLSLICSIVLVSLFLPYITEFLKTDTPVYEYITEQCQLVVSEQVAAGLAGNPGGDQDMADSSAALPDTLALTEEEQESVIRSLPLPEMLRKQILKYNNKDGYRSLQVSTFQDYIIHYIASAILNILAFLLSVILVQVLIHVLIHCLKILSHVPGISFVNRLAGGAVGILQWLFLMWLFFLVLSMSQSTEIGQYLLKMVWDSDFLNMLYDSNLFIQIVLRAAAIFA